MLAQRSNPAGPAAARAGSLPAALAVAMTGVGSQRGETIPLLRGLYVCGFVASEGRFFFCLARLAASASAIAFAEGANPARKAS